MTTRLMATVLSLLFLSLAMLFGPLLLIGCDPGPTIQCDYCRAPRAGAQRYICDKCTKPHAACDAEKSILHYTERKDGRGYLWYSATSIHTCPAEAVIPVAVAEKPEPENPPDKKTLTPTQRGSLMALAIMMSLLLGYAAGKTRRGQLIKLENKKGVVS